VRRLEFAIDADDAFNSREDVLGSSDWGAATIVPRISERVWFLTTACCVWPVSSRPWRSRSGARR
jgi:hypothetical protein